MLKSSRLYIGLWSNMGKSYELKLKSDGLSISGC
jgi:hypothetical protein